MTFDVMDNCPSANDSIVASPIYKEMMQKYAWVIEELENRTGLYIGGIRNLDKVGDAIISKVRLKCSFNFLTLRPSGWFRKIRISGETWPPTAILAVVCEFQLLQPYLQWHPASLPATSCSTISCQYWFSLLIFYILLTKYALLVSFQIGCTPSYLLRWGTWLWGEQNDASTFIRGSV